MIFPESHEELKSSFNIRTTWDIIHKLCMYDLATQFNRRPVSLAAPVMVSNCAPCLTCIVVLNFMFQVKDHFHIDLYTCLTDQFTMIIELAYRKLQISPIDSIKMIY